MATRIWKYAVPIDERSHTFKANIRKILAVGNQNREVVFWAEVEVDRDRRDCDLTFQVFLTGQDLPDDRYYLGSTSFDTATIKPFVAHLYHIPSVSMANLVLEQCKLCKHPTLPGDGVITPKGFICNGCFPKDEADVKELFSTVKGKGGENGDRICDKDEAAVPHADDDLGSLHETEGCSHR